MTTKKKANKKKPVKPEIIICDWTQTLEKSFIREI